MQHCTIRRSVEGSRPEDRIKFHHFTDSFRQQYLGGGEITQPLIEMSALNRGLV
jgi:hypothetical protein